MDENQLEDLTQKLQSADPNNPQPINGSSTQPSNDDNQQQVESKPSQNFAFATPSEMGLRETDPNKIPAAPRPQPGMTFTPTGGSVSNIHHQLNQKDETDEQNIVEPTQQQ